MVGFKNLGVAIFGLRSKESFSTTECQKEFLPVGSEYDISSRDPNCLFKLGLPTRGMCSGSFSSGGKLLPSPTFIGKTLPDSLWKRFVVSPSQTDKQKVELDMAVIGKSEGYGSWMEESLTDDSPAWVLKTGKDLKENVRSEMRLVGYTSEGDAYFIQNNFYERGPIVFSFVKFEGCDLSELGLTPGDVEILTNTIA